MRNLVPVAIFAGLILWKVASVRAETVTKPAERLPSNPYPGQGVIRLAWLFESGSPDQVQR